jgi:hypothetical protein
MPKYKNKVRTNRIFFEPVLLWNIFILLLCLGSAADAQTAQAKTLPPAEQRVTDAASGYDFVIPAGWKSQQSDEGFGLVNAAQTIVIAVKAHNYANFDAFAADANLERDGLELVGKVQDLSGGKVLRTVKRTPQGTVVIDTSVLFSPHGGGTVVVALSNETNAEEAFNKSVQIAQTVRFFKPQESDVATQWQKALSGKHLLYLYTASGYTERKDIYLCASGTFYQGSDAGGFNPNDSGDGSFGARSSKSGTWKVAARGGLKLILQFQNGATAEYAITRRQAGNEVGLNGQRFFVQAHNKCQ